MDRQAAHILIVDDDEGIRALLQKFLQRHGYRTTVAIHAQDAREKMQELHFDLLVLDIMMPGESGLEFAASLRKTNQTIPILILTARGEPVHRVEGLQLGVDDYMPKPFEPEELLLRLNKILRYAAKALTPAPPDSVRFGDFTFIYKSGQLRKGAEHIALTTNEIDMLRRFSAHHGRIISRAELASKNDGTQASYRAVDVQINRLRRKIEDNPKEPLLLQTVRAKGYILNIDA